MTIKDLQEAFKLIEINKENEHLSGPKDENLIALAEKALDLKFPPTYRLFLKKYGCGGIGSSEFYGLTKKSAEGFTVPGGPDGIWLTLTRRKKWNLPVNFIAIASLGEGSEYYLDASQTNENGEYPVVICWNDIPENKEKVAEDFGEFLLEQTKRALED